jgi:hypothetical protein
MGDVYTALDHRLGRDVAIKVIASHRQLSCGGTGTLRV